MKALTLKRPWPYFFTELPEPAAKRVENRNWKPSFEVRKSMIPPAVLEAATFPVLLEEAEIFIHSGKGWIREKEEEYLLEEILAAEERVKYLTDRDCHGSLFPAGAIVFKAKLWACVPETACIEVSQHRWISGDFWILKDIVKLPRPVFCRGRQGLWTVSPDVEAEVRRLLNGEG